MFTLEEILELAKECGVEIVNSDSGKHYIRSENGLREFRPGSELGPNIPYKQLANIEYVEYAMMQDKTANEYAEKVNDVSREEFILAA